MKTFLRYATHHSVLLIVVAALALASGFYLSGYRLDGAGFSQVATLRIDNLPAGTALYIDETRRVEAPSGTGQAELSAGPHSVIVDAPGYQPWHERFTLGSGETLVLKPLLVKDKVAARKLEGEEAAQALTLIRSSLAPTKAAPLRLAGGCAAIYASGNRVLAEATTSPSCIAPAYLSCAPVSEENPKGACATTIIRTDSGPVRAMIPYPGRDDTAIVVGDNAVYALELDPREPQSYALLFKGPTIGVAPWSDSSVVVSNGSLVFELTP